MVKSTLISEIPEEIACFIQLVGQNPGYSAILSYLIIYPNLYGGNQFRLGNK